MYKNLVCILCWKKHEFTHMSLYRDEIGQPPLHLPTHIMEEKLKILGRNHKFGEIKSFYPLFSCILQTFIVITLNRTAMFWLQ